VDKTLREAERSGDAAGVLRNRTRVGDLTEAHVELAASLGHAAARELCPNFELLDFAPRTDAKVEGVGPGNDFDWGNDDHDSWRIVIMSATRLLGATLPLRVGADFAERTLLRTEKLLALDTIADNWWTNEGYRKLLREKLSAVRAWVDCPCEEHRRAAASLVGTGEGNKVGQRTVGGWNVYKAKG
jgi:hypothetical protein